MQATDHILRCGVWGRRVGEAVEMGQEERPEVNSRVSKWVKWHRQQC